MGHWSPSTMSKFTRKVGDNCKLLWLSTQSYSTVTASLPDRFGTLAKRTLENNPAKHCQDHENLFYTVPEAVKKQLFSSGGLPKPFLANTKTFSECCFLVRRPALELIQRLNNTDFSKPAVRYVLYGKIGCGKSITLAHLLHYAFMEKFVIVHVPWTWNWFRRDWTEVTYSSKNKYFVDLPVLSALWLKHFQLQNSDLDSLNLVTSQDYVWSQREQTPAGSPLSALVTHGINRVKFAGDCVMALIDELKKSCNEDKCKVFVAVDGFNALVGDYATNLITEDKTKIRSGMVTLSHAFQNATKQDWKNGAVIVTVDQLACSNFCLKSHWPIYLLGRQGFEHLDPFVPILLTEYNDVELSSVLDYYEDRMWLQRTEGRHELGFLSNNNPYTLMNLCAGM